MKAPTNFETKENAGIWSLAEAKQIAASIDNDTMVAVTVMDRLDWPVEYEHQLDPMTPARIAWGDTGFFVAQSHPCAK